MVWTVEYSEPAERVLGKLDSASAKRIVQYMHERVALSGKPREKGTALVGSLKGLWRYRVGDFRVICRIEDTRLVVLVVAIGNRRDIYR